MRETHSLGGTLVVFPELCLTSFFPRWFIEDQAEIDLWFENEMPSRETQPLFDLAHKLGVGFCLGYAELFKHKHYVYHFNTSILVNQSGKIVGKYRKVHLPGTYENRPEFPFQHLEKRYFNVGDLGFPTFRTMGGVMGMMICNDRRWPESYRTLALRGAEIILLGYNTPASLPWDPLYDNLSTFHNHLVMQAGAYQNGSWVVGVAKAGLEEGCDLIGGTSIIAPSGQIVAQCAGKEDELITAQINMDLSVRNKNALLNFAAHRRIEHYQIISEQTGVTSPD